MNQLVEDLLTKAAATLAKSESRAVDPKHALLSCLDIHLASRLPKELAEIVQALGGKASEQQKISALLSKARERVYSELQVKRFTGGQFSVKQNSPIHQYVNVKEEDKSMTTETNTEKTTARKATAKKTAAKKATAKKATAKKATAKKATAKKTAASKVPAASNGAGRPSVMEQLPALQKLLKQHKDGVTINELKGELGLCRRSVVKLLAEAKAKSPSRGLYTE